MDGYWVASHITGFFVICNGHTNPLYKGSRGAGFSISRGVKTYVEFSEDKNNHYFFNDIEVEPKIANVSNYVVKRLTASINVESGINVYHYFEIPLSAGYGASAAGAVGVAFALNELLDLRLCKRELLAIAHIAEVEEGGGLGDVIGLFEGGWEYRIKEGAPYIGITRKMEIDKKYNIATISFGEIPTAKIIKDDSWKNKINAIGKKALTEFLKKPTVSNFIKQSNYFSSEAGLETDEIKKFREEFETERLKLCQIMLGNSVFLLYDNIKDLKNISGVSKEEICLETIKRL